MSMAPDGPSWAMRPCRIGSSPEIAASVVVLPAPISATISPGSTVRLTPRSICAVGPSASILPLLIATSRPQVAVIMGMLCCNSTMVSPAWWFSLVMRSASAVFSAVFIPEQGEDAPVPGNAAIDEGERERRRAAIWAPFHAGLGRF